MDRVTALTEALDAVESQAPETPEVVQPVETQEVETEQARADRVRDEQGRFAPKVEAAPVEPALEQPIQRPSAWKKEYWPLYDKLHKGEALTPEEARKLVDYTNERENQFKSGVSTYKAEAEQAREVQTAMAPFMPILQQYNIKPGQWIANLGNAHRVLAEGSPQERVRMFHQLAKEYGVDLGQLTEGAQQQDNPADQQIRWLTDQLKQVSGTVTQWQTAQQQRESQELMSQIESVRGEKGSNGQPLRPHFDEVKAQMSGLLSAGIAQDLNDAYDKAIRMNDTYWQQHQAQQAAASAQQRIASAQAVVSRAKASAVSPRSASPSATGDQSAKGRRAILEATFEATDGASRV